MLVGWLNAGSSVEDFSEGFHMDMDTLMVAVDYLRNDPPVGVVDLTDCPVVEPNESGDPSFQGTGFPVEALFNFLKSGRTAEEFQRYLRSGLRPNTGGTRLRQGLVSPVLAD